MPSNRRDKQRATLTHQGAQALELLDQGFSVREICDLLGIVRSRYYRALRAYDEATLM